jgi:hypothetical protein
MRTGRQGVIQRISQRYLEQKLEGYPEKPEKLEKPERRKPGEHPKRGFP